MPPKPKKASEPSKKTQEKKKEKVIEDKTFGIKNKKGKKQQQFIKNVSNQVKYGQQSVQKVCKHFLHAIEKCVYGWFWDCPNGDKCIYRHALPPGFVLKKQKEEQEQEEKTITIEELVEQERAKLAASSEPLTKVTLETFLAWKKRKLREKQYKSEEEAAKKKEAFKAGRTHGISGREMFEFNPELMAGDEDEEGEDEDVVVCVKEEDENEEQIRDITRIHAVMDEESSDTKENKSALSSLSSANAAKPSSSRPNDRAEGESRGGGEGEGGGGGGGGEREEEEGKEEEEEEEEERGAVAGALVVEQAVEIDENLFDIDDLGELDIEEDEEEEDGEDTAMN